MLFEHLQDALGERFVLASVGDEDIGFHIFQRFEGGQAARAKASVSMELTKLSMSIFRASNI